MIVNVILWISFYVKFKKTFSPNKILENIGKEVDKLLIEIDNITDRDLSLIENRIQTLREVISQADRRISLAKKEDEKRLQETVVLDKINEINENVKKSNSSMTSYVKNAYKIKEKQNNNGEISLFPAEDYGEESKSNINVRDNRPLKDRVLELYYQGLDFYIIAEKLESSVDEVQTIVNLFVR